MIFVVVCMIGFTSLPRMFLGSAGRYFFGFLKKMSNLSCQLMKRKIVTSIVFHYIINMFIWSFYSTDKQFVYV